MIILTGAAGFIGSNILTALNEENYKDIILSDDFSRKEKSINYKGKVYTELVHRDDLFGFIRENARFVQAVIHMGARTDTAEFNWEIFRELNLEYSKKLWDLCVEFGLPFIYASSAATYGLGEFGYDDSHEIIPSLRPLNPYGRSKNEFDRWALQQVRKPFFWAGLKFFNVYGPNEYHKERMASVILHSYKQIEESGKVKLFRSHHPEFEDGGQKRDFIYVKDVADVILFLLEQRPQSGIFNLGTGMADTFMNLATYTFEAMGLEPDIEFIDTPADIRDKYQYFTEANMLKLQSVGYDFEFTSLKEGIFDYVQNYLRKSSIN